jgi:hypothetical protein
MRKFLLMALTGLALAAGMPLTASAAPVPQGEGIRIAVDAIAPIEEVRHRWWHCRWRSGRCGYRYHYYHYPRYRYRYWRHRHWRHRHYRRHWR